ncbi:hypothetical protein [Ectothiorhodospira sp. BSL-9]|uniref:hypothetical protein n=1 Tax=Ectothiorhodospira sp. BSL-9 TaxID=1442136 RepID=UPI001F0A431C|nr:hypothetical protein [Ectothiorhodospira sp. BSL-9]
MEAILAGFVVDARWMEDRGWLDRLERGVFRRPGPQPVPPDWQSCVLSPAHHGLSGRMWAAYPPSVYRATTTIFRLVRTPPVWLHGDDTPSWLSRLTLDAALGSRPLSLFSDPALPYFEAIGLPQAQTLPAVRWKLFSLKKLEVADLEQALEGS